MKPRIQGPWNGFPAIFVLCLVKKKNHFFNLYLKYLNLSQAKHCIFISRSFSRYHKKKKTQTLTAQPTFASAAKRQTWQSLNKKKDLQFFFKAFKLLYKVLGRLNGFLDSYAESKRLLAQLLCYQLVWPSCTAKFSYSSELALWLFLMDWTSAKLTQNCRQFSDGDPLLVSLSVHNSEPWKAKEHLCWLWIHCLH